MHQLLQKGTVREAGRYGWQADLLNTHQVSQTLKRNVQTHFPFGNGRKKKNIIKGRKKIQRAFVREGRHARVAPEANRLNVRLHKSV